MTNLELAKYWYYRLKKRVDANNGSDAITNRVKLLEAYLKKYEYIKLDSEQSQKEYFIFLLRAATHYGKDFRQYIPNLKSNLFKYLWDTRPDGFRYSEYLKRHKSETDNLKAISNALKRLHPYSETTRYEQIITPLAEDEKKDDQIFIENGIKYKITLKKREYLVPIHLVPNENILADSYIDCSKYTDSIEFIELKKLFKQLKPPEKEISQLIQDILIDQHISINSLEYNEHKKRNEELSNKTKTIEDLNSKITRLAIDNKDTNRELAVAHKLIKKQKKQKSDAKLIHLIPTKEEMEILIDKNRFKESQIVNCSAIGRILGRDADTIKRWIINELCLKSYAYPNR